MPETNYQTNFSLYLHELGLPTYKGYWYMKQILLRYMETALLEEPTDYNRLVAEVAAERGVSPNSVKSAIKRYASSYWRRGFSGGWAPWTGWDQVYPPDAATAIRMICELFIPVMEKYQDTIQDLW